MERTRNRFFSLNIPRSQLFKYLLVTFALCYGYTIYIRTALNTSNFNEALAEEAKDLVAKDYRYAETYRKLGKFVNELKYILLWTPADYAPFDFVPQGQKSFIQNNCANTNCYITSDRAFLKSISMFDAIAFNGRKIESEIQFPKSRSPHQKYIFFNMESAENYPVCSKKFDGYFNWTATYRLVSDIPWTYFLIENNEGTIIGPNKHMDWIELGFINDNYKKNKEIIQSKSKAAAWFVSNCNSKSNREQFEQNLQKALGNYNLEVDVYGSCGKLSCPRNEYEMCNAMLENSYYFYLSLENSLEEDYVTEKLMTALENYAVPIVFGGADYSRFLPPGSYINGRDQNATELAGLIYHLMRSPEEYLQYFRWRDHYKYATGPNMCLLCDALNNQTLMENKSAINNFRSWWYPKYKSRCGSRIFI